MIDYLPPADPNVVLREWLRPRPAFIEKANLQPIGTWIKVLLPGTVISSSTGHEGAYRAAWVGDMPWPLPGSLSRDLSVDLKPLGCLVFLRSTE